MSQPQFAKVDVEFREDEPFVAPSNPYATIWRYLDFTRFVALLDTEELFFAPVAAFEDHFEGSYSALNIDGREDFWARHFPNDAATMASSYSEIARELPRWIFANCWNLSEDESAALWGLYVPASGGVAVRSTYQSLVDCFKSAESTGERQESLYIGKVRYLDYKRELIPEHDPLFPFVHKRRSFEFESELRAVIKHYPESKDPEGGVNAEEFQEGTPPDGVTVPVDLARLIEAIHVSPTAPPWFLELVSSVADRYGCFAEVTQSSLADEPLF